MDEKVFLHILQAAVIEQRSALFNAWFRQPLQENTDGAATSTVNATTKCTILRPVSSDQVRTEAISYFTCSSPTDPSALTVLTGLIGSNCIKYLSPSQTTI
jgi:hypothetical protein